VAQGGVCAVPSGWLTSRSSGPPARMRSPRPLNAVFDLRAIMDPFGTMKQHLDRTDDPTLLILRAHLLVEERLRDVLARICRSSEEVLAARLSFHQVLCLCRAVVGRQEDPAWGFVARLNEVRNRMVIALIPVTWTSTSGRSSKSSVPTTPTGSKRRSIGFGLWPSTHVVTSTRSEAASG